MSHVDSVLARLRITTPLIEEYRGRLAIYKGVKERLQQNCDEGVLKECLSLIKQSLNDRLLLEEIERKLG